jgi:hypothetical protein
MSNDDLTIAFCGDIMMGGDVALHLGSSTATEWLSGVAPAWRDADLLVGNLECPCVLNAQPVDGPVPELIFRAPATRLKELADAGFRALTIANNHILNCGDLGLYETISSLEKVGIYHAGAGMNIVEATRPAFIPIRGRVVALVAFCYSLPAGPRTAGVAPATAKVMRQVLAKARASADFVVAALHDGLEYSDVPPSAVRAKFRYLAENGADIVVGHHPHVLQGLEWHRNVPIAYSLGDLLFANSLPHIAARNFARIAMGRYAPHEIQRDPDKFARGAVLKVLVSGKTKSLLWVPFRQTDDLRPELLHGSARAAALEAINDLSGALQNPSDPRHSLADEVMQCVRAEKLATLGVADVFRLALRPRLRHFRSGLPWVYHRIRNRFGAQVLGKRR